MKTWDEVRPWRKERRAERIAYRSSLPRPEREIVRDRVTALLRQQVPGLATATIGFYWPFKGEIDLRPLLRELVAGGAKAALPAVVEKARPVEFRPWYPGVTLERGIWDIPVPAPGALARPTILFVPLVGFDADGYRLGHGGGYYDRTLATLSPKPLTIGVGYEATRLETIHPQPHDIPMDAIATEAGFVWFERARAALRRIEGPRGDADESGFASPACAMHEHSAAYMGYLADDEIVALLTELLGALSDKPCVRTTLSRHLVRLGGPVSAAAAPSDRDHAWVVRRIAEALPKIADDALARDLRGLLQDPQHPIATAGAS